MTAPIGARLRELREAAGLTQAEVADRMDTWTACIDEIEYRDECRPDFEEIERYAAACGYRVVVSFERAE